jgi:hypothetical protein
MDKRIELPTPQPNARKIRLDGVFTRDNCRIIRLWRNRMFSSPPGPKISCYAPTDKKNFELAVIQRQVRQLPLSEFENWVERSAG